MDTPLLRVKEAAEVLRVSRWTIYRWVEEGRLRGTKLGRGSLRIFSESVMALVERHRTDDDGAMFDSLCPSPGGGDAVHMRKGAGAFERVRVARGGRYR